MDQVVKTELQCRATQRGPPRTLWEIETEDAALVLSFSRRTGAWSIQAFDDAWATLPFATGIPEMEPVLVHA